MRRVATASSFESTWAGAVRRRLLGQVCFWVFALAAFAGSALPAAAAGPCPNEAIREQQRIADLPGCRAYEKISPDDKGGLDVAGVNVGGANVQVGPGGNSVAYMAPGAFPGAESSGVAVAYLARRQADSWGTFPISPPLDPHTRLFGGGTITHALSSDLSKAAVLTNAVLTPEVTVSGPERFNLFLRDLDDGGYRLVTTVPDPESAALFAANARFVGASADFSRVIFEHVANLTPDASGPETKLYEWVDGSPSSLRLVSAGFPSGSAGSGGPLSGAESLGSVASIEHAMSADGSRIFFTTPGGGKGDIYLQQDGSSNTLINASERTDGSGTPEPDPSGPQPALFWTASSDGSKALFTTSEQLTDSDRDQTEDLYEYAADAPAGHHLTRISFLGADPTAEAQVQGVVGAGDDLSTVYFVGAAQMIPGKGEAGAPNLYVWRNGEVEYVATFGSGDRAYDIHDFANNVSHTVTVDGDRLAFDSSQAQEACGDPAVPVLCQTGGHSQVYLYDAPSGRLTCASCDPSSAETDGTAKLSVIHDQARGVSPFLTPISNLTDDGTRLFFNSQTALSAEDTNGVVDAYEWDEGDLRPISSGRDSEESQFMAASPDGRDVYFQTINRLVGRDRDSLFDLYDAREEGGFDEPPPALAPCEADGCRRPAQPQPGFAPPVTSSGVGNGNARPVRKKSHKKKHRKKKHHTKKNQKHHTKKNQKQSHRKDGSGK